MNDNDLKAIGEASNKGEAYELAENIPINPTGNATLGDIIHKRYHRRTVLKGALAVTAISGSLGHMLAGAAPAKAAKATFSFEEIPHGVDETHHVAPGYDADILIRWGDPVTKGAPAFDPHNQTPEAQEQQFGYNNDYIGFLPLPQGSGSADHGLLFVNHEYTNEELMFPGVGRQDREAQFSGMTQDLTDIEMSAHGGSIVEIKREGGKWQVVPDSQYARRITTRTTKMRIVGPAAGSDRMKTSADETGTEVIGMLNNCAGSVTPWGTVLTGEENIRGYFWIDDKEKVTDPHYKRYGVPGRWYGWGKFHDRFDIEKEPNESNRFGYIVEVDPYDPTSVPVKHTALGRAAHEGASVIINGDGRAVAYSGDDARFEYLYKFVSAGKFDPEDRAKNMTLLEEGTLYAARFDEDGTVTWLPLVAGDGPLTAEAGFASQADVAISTRQAADLVGATKMDRPEDVDPNPITGKVYVMLTNNTKRKPEQVDAANPRADNKFGHIIEITPADGDHAATTSSWEILIKAGDPSVAEVGALYHPDTTENGWFAAPDNCAIDHQGRLWVTTDQGGGWGRTGTADGVFAVETEGELRGLSRMFFRVPVGAEMCGPEFTPDDTTLFVAVQHPAADGVKQFAGFERNSTFEDPATRWPDFDDNMPVRPSVVAITKQDGGKIGV